MRATRSRQVENCVVAGQPRGPHRRSGGLTTAPDGEVFEARGADQRGVVQIAAVEHERLLERAASAAKSGLRNSFHSVTTTSASAPATASIGVAANVSRGDIAERAPRRGHRDRIVGDDVARRAARAPAMISSDGASRTSSVFGLNASPQIANRRPARSGPRRATIFSTSRSFCASFAASTAPRILQRPSELASRCAAAPSRPSESTSRRSPRPDTGIASRSADRSRCPGGRARCRRRARRRGSRARS